MKKLSMWGIAPACLWIILCAVLGSCTSQHKMELSHSAPTNDTLSLWRIEVLIPAKYIDRMSGSAIDAGFSSYSVKWNGSGNLSTIQLLFQAKDREQVDAFKEQLLESGVVQQVVIIPERTRWSMSTYN